jgi:hypothetical protein
LASCWLGNLSDSNPITMKVSKRFVDRARKNLRKYQKAFESARVRDVGESDTCVIISDFLADILGYDKYADVTTEFAIRSTFCDLAIKTNGQLHFLIEVKSIGTELKDIHAKQAIDYGANQGVDWVLLTNGARWRAYKLRFEKPIQADLAFEIDLLDPEAKPNHLLEKLYLISKEAGGGGAMETYYRQQEAKSRYVLGQLLLSEPILRIARRELRRLFPDVRATKDELAGLLRGEVIKRDVLDGDRAVAAEKLIRKSTRKLMRARGATSAGAKGEGPSDGTPVDAAPAVSPGAIAQSG